MKINEIFLLDAFDFLDQKVEKETIDLAIVDPPYNNNQEEWDSFESESQYWEFTFKWLDKLIPKLKKTGSLYLFNNAYNSAIIFNYLIKKGMVFQNWIIWYKKDGFSVTKKKYVNNQETILFFTVNKDYYFNSELIRVPYESESRIEHAKKKGILKNGKRWFPNENGKLCSDVWHFSSVRHFNKIDGKLKKYFHPTAKPEKMIERIILASSEKDNLVLDLFSGSGTTSYIAKKLSRNFIGCESNINFFNFAKKRLEEIDVNLSTKDAGIKEHTQNSTK